MALPPLKESLQLILAINPLTSMIFELRGCKTSERIHRSTTRYFESSRRLDRWWRVGPYKLARFEMAHLRMSFRTIRSQPAYLSTKADLDADPVVRGRPIVLLSKDGHAFWCSKKAVSLSSPLPDAVEGGIIFQDSDGRPTGTLHKRYIMN